MQATSQSRVRESLRVKAVFPSGGQVWETFFSTPTEENFGPVAEILSPLLLRYFRTRGCDLSIAEELTQDVLFTVFRSVGTLRERTLFQAWVYAVARNCLLQRWRKLGHTVPTVSLDRTSLDRTSLAYLVESPAGPAVAGSTFAELVSCLTPEEREILTLRYIDELDYREIAKVLQIPVGTAKWRVFNSKMKLSLHLGWKKKGTRTL